jgi:NAD(P)-dependent dehydrogenase (short-subunit alcohol dehydrogenase family)
MPRSGNTLFHLDGKVALITGGAHGLGRMIAAGLATAGATVYITSRKAEAAERSALELSAIGPCHGLTANLATPEAAVALAAELKRRESRLDILVNNAGTNPYFGPLIDIDPARAQKTFEVNQLAVLMWTSYAVKAGLSGSVVNVASVGGLSVESGIGWYNVTKAAVIHLTKQLAFELAPDIRVNALAPGLVKTKLAQGLWDGPNADRVVQHIPLRRLGLPDDIATAALFLASDAASWITGETLVVDGGTLRQPSGGIT